MYHPTERSILFPAQVGEMHTTMPKPEGQFADQIQIAMEWSSIMVFNTANQYQGKCNAGQVHVCPLAAIFKIQATYKIILSLSSRMSPPIHLARSQQPRAE